MLSSLVSCSGASWFRSQNRTRSKSRIVLNDESHGCMHFCWDRCLCSFEREHPSCFQHWGGWRPSWYIGVDQRLFLMGEYYWILLASNDAPSLVLQALSQNPPFLHFPRAVWRHVYPSNRSFWILLYLVFSPLYHASACWRLCFLHVDHGNMWCPWPLRNTYFSARTLRFRRP